MDIPSDVGLEIFRDSEKIAQIYCATDQHGLIAGMYQIHCNKDWSRAEFASIEEAVSLIAACESGAIT